MTDPAEDDAFEMFNAVHDRLGHRDLPAHYFDQPYIKQMWIEVARLVDDAKYRSADAYEMFRIVHRRIGDGRDQTARSDFDAMQQLKYAWLVIADEVRARTQPSQALCEP